MQNESVAFSAYGQEFVSSGLREIKQIMESLKQKTESKSGNAETTNYLILNSGDAKNLFIEYWSVNGTVANQIKAGTLLTSYTNYSVDTSGLRLLTSSGSGRNPLSSRELLIAYKQALMTRERIVTSEDVRVTCMKELGGSVEDIKVKRGWKLDTNSESGFIRTTDVFIRLDENNGSSKGDAAVLCRRLENVLELRSSCLTTFRVFIEN